MSRRNTLISPVLAASLFLSACAVTVSPQQPSFLSGASQRWITSFFARHNRIINIVGGLLLVGLAVYDLGSNWELIRAYLGA